MRRLIPPVFSDTSGYFGAIEDDERALDRAIAVSDNRERGVVAIQAANYNRKQFEPVSTRFGGLDDASPPATEIESVQWCPDELVDAPVVTGEINGGPTEVRREPPTPTGG